MLISILCLSTSHKITFINKPIYRSVYSTASPFILFMDYGDRAAPDEPLVNHLAAKDFDITHAVLFITDSCT